MTNYVKEVCKIGQGNDCCRYTLMGSQGWQCGKIDPVMKAQLDDRVILMVANGDNCEGVTDLEAKSKES